MLRNLLDGLDAVGAPLERVVLYQGAKVYGVHLGPVPAPRAPAARRRRPARRGGCAASRRSADPLRRGSDAARARRRTAPFYEDENPRHIGPNFYFTQEDVLRRRAERGGAAWLPGQGRGHL
jgi:hypothetical protein